MLHVSLYDILKGIDELHAEAKRCLLAPSLIWQQYDMRGNPRGLQRFNLIVVFLTFTATPICRFTRLVAL